ncbi:MAG: class I SAM-dependent methyltransferase [Candidatus Thermoplasmatota archaeon]|nr:class I SAM-dependent methyltransferase [Candidatus Thermoplasmatota archaeon]
MEREIPRTPPRTSPSGSHILDIGCGSGVPITRFLLSRGHRVTGVDIARRQIERARRLVPQATLLGGDIMRASFPDEMFDAVVSFYAIIHLPRDEHGSLFRRIYRMLRRGGLLLATLGSDDWVGTEEYQTFGVRMYWSHFGPDVYRRMLSDVGFQILQYSTEQEEFEGEREMTFYVLAVKI